MLLSEKQNILAELATSENIKAIDDFQRKVNILISFLLLFFVVQGVVYSFLEGGIKTHTFEMISIIVISGYIFSFVLNNKFRFDSVKDVLKSIIEDDEFPLESKDYTDDNNYDFFVEILVSKKCKALVEAVEVKKYDLVIYGMLSTSIVGISYMLSKLSSVLHTVSAFDYAGFALWICFGLVCVCFLIYGIETQMRANSILKKIRGL